MTANQTTPDHIGDANKMVSTMPERIWARPSYTWLNIQGINQTAYIRESIHEEQLNQSLLAQSMLREAGKLLAASEQCPNCDNVGWYGDKNCSDLPHEAEQVQCQWCYAHPKSRYNALIAWEAALSTNTPPTDRIVVTREMVEKWDCNCQKYNKGGWGNGTPKCPRCQLLAQFPSEQTTKEKGEQYA